MAGFETVIQLAVINQLKANAELVALAGIYDSVPKTTVYPYVIIGDDFGVDDSTDDFIRRETISTIHSWSRDRGKEETKLIQGYLDEILNRTELTMVGYSNTLIHIQSSDSFLEADGKTRHGIVNFKLITKRI